MALASAIKEGQKLATPQSFYSETIADNTVNKAGKPESSTWQIAIPELTAANVVAKEGLLTTLSAAVGNVILGNLLRTQIVLSRDDISSAPAALQSAQRENKLLIRYHGVVSNKKFNVSIPTFDLTLLPNHSEFLDLTTGDGATLKAAFEAIAVSPDDDTELVILDTAQFVGRNT